jgi:hypothetical protein
MIALTGLPFANFWTMQHPMFSAYLVWKQKLTWSETTRFEGDFSVPNAVCRHIKWLNGVLRAVIAEFECHKDMMTQNKLTATTWRFPISIDLTNVPPSPLETQSNIFMPSGMIVGMRDSIH